MRVVSDDGREVVATDEQLTSVTQLQGYTLREVQHLNLSFNALTTLDGLQSATQLRNLNISHNSLTSLRGVEGFHSLRRLRCSSNALSDLSWLASLPCLEELWVNDNCIEMPQISHLAVVKTLRVLVLHPNPCTNGVNFVQFVVQTLPWLRRVDMTVVDDALRRQSEHADARAVLSSASTDVSEISLMTSRSDDALPEHQAPENLNQMDPGNVSSPSQSAVLLPVTAIGLTNKKKPKKAKMSAEDFMRAFPVQDFIPLTEASVQLNPQSQKAAEFDPNRVVLPTSSPTSLSSVSFRRPLTESNQDADEVVSSTVDTYAQSDNSPIAVRKTDSAISAIAGAVLALPSFAGDSILLKKKTSKAKSTKGTKKSASSKSIASASADPSVASFQQHEWIQAYPNSTVNVIQVRSDGSAVAKWPNGSVAVSVDRERDGFRCYAAHKDGSIALSFDAGGVGFVNYHPSGRMMISTSSSGDGLYFSSDGTILRQWNAQLQMKNEKGETTNKLSNDAPGGSLVAKLSNGLGVRLELKLSGTPGTGPQRPSSIYLQIYFNSGAGIRHAFCNWINKTEASASDCDAVFGKDPPKLMKKASATQVHTHVSTLDEIRASVAKLG